MRVLVACEFSGTVRDAFAAEGHDAWSCDLLPTETSGNHFQDDLLNVVGLGWDLMIAHPPCTDLASAGARWFPEKVESQVSSLAFVKFLMDLDIPRIAIENPVGVISSKIRKPDQIIQPWEYGHPETKATCLWLKNLPKLRPTNPVLGVISKVALVSPSPDRWKIRAKTYPGIAQAMAIQWGWGVSARMKQRTQLPSIEELME